MVIHADSLYIYHFEKYNEFVSNFYDFRWRYPNIDKYSFSYMIYVLILINDYLI
jgi:hypothetical protein